MTTFFEFFKSNSANKWLFYAMSAATLIAFVWSLIMFGIQFRNFGQTEKDNGLYMNLSPNPIGGTCAAEPFVHYQPLEFTYITENGKYSYECTPSVFINFIGHVAVIFSFAFFCFCCYIFGIVAVQKKVLYFIPFWFIFCLAMLIVGAFEISNTKDNMDFCENELIKRVFEIENKENNITPELVPTGIECNMNKHSVFGGFEIALSLYGFVVCTLISIVYAIWRRKKEQQRASTAYGEIYNEEVETEQNGLVHQPQKDVTPGMNSPMPVFDETTENNSIAPEKKSSSSSSSSSKHSYSSNDSDKQQL